MLDLFEMMQSLTFVQQLGYGLLKILVVNLLPELKPLWRAIERGPYQLESQSPRAGVPLFSLILELMSSLPLSFDKYAKKLLMCFSHLYALV